MINTCGLIIVSHMFERFVVNMNDIIRSGGNRLNPAFFHALTTIVQEMNRGAAIINAIHKIGGLVLAPKNPPVTISLVGLNSINPVGVNKE